MQLIVLGMHRSGTSGVTRLLNLAGAWFGPDGIATGANEENPRGFWERRDVRAVCDGILASTGHDWWRVSGFDPGAVPVEDRERWQRAFGDVLAELDDHRPWVVKEPRLCVVLPVLLPLLDSPVCVHVTREPVEVARSLHRRDATPIPAGLALWELYTVRAFEASRGLPRVQVRYDELIADPVAATARLVDQLTDLGVAGLRVPTSEAITDFITADLHRQREQPEARRDRLTQHQADLARLVDDGSALAGVPIGPVSTGALEVLAAHEAARDRTAELERRSASLDREAQEHERRAREHERWGREHERRAGEQERRVRELSEQVARLDRYRQVELERRRELGRVAERSLAVGMDRLGRLQRSRTGRLATSLVSARQRLAARGGPVPAAPIAAIRRDLGVARRDIATRAAQEPAPGGAPVSAVTTDHPLIRRTRSARASTGRPSVAVISWDVGHNPLGRANVLAELLGSHFDVELWGAQFDRYGTDVWAPLQGAETPINVFPGRSFPDHLAIMREVASQIDADLIWVSKPRLPSYLLGILAKQARNRPLVLDVDDHELAFFGEDAGLPLDQVVAGRDVGDLSMPFERAWTRACDPFIDAADAVTVSNVALQQRYGGLIVPHARDEHRFDPAAVDRDEVRRSLGVGTEERLVLFGGTPRAHKGVVEVLAALDEIGDDRNRLLVFGTREFDELRPQIGDLARWARVLPAQSFDDLPSLVAAADLACVVQQVDHPVSRYQLPAKVSDALAMRVPCLVAPTPPLAPLIDQGVVHVLEPGQSLAKRIAEVLDDPDATSRAERGREVFLAEMSYGAVAEVVVPAFERLLEDVPRGSPRLAELAAAPARAFAGSPGVPPVPAHPVRAPRRLAADPPPFPLGAEFDVVMFWKQNDSGIYGRRQDMFLAELARSERVGTIVHFDNPITPEEVLRARRSGRKGVPDQGRLVAEQTIARILHRRDEPGVHRRTFVHGGGRVSRRLPVARRTAYVDHVREVLARCRVGPGGSGRPLVVWAYPTNEDLPALIDALDPAVVVADVVDDNRTWYEEGAPLRARVERNYAEVLARADLVIANCEPVAGAMQALAGQQVHVVANGCELPALGPRPPRPAPLDGLRGPVVAYVGNLSARIDVALLEAVASARPDWNLVLVGSAHLDASILDLDRLANVHFLGVKPHHEVRDLLAHVDVGIIPHLSNEMTRSMNPLKAFVYAAAGVPVVSTPVDNLAEIGDLITVAADADGFVAAIEAALVGGRPEVDVEVLRPHSWGSRMDQVLELLDDTSDPLGPSA